MSAEGPQIPKDQGNVSTALVHDGEGQEQSDVSLVPTLTPDTGERLDEDKGAHIPQERIGSPVMNSLASHAMRGALAAGDFLRNPNIGERVTNVVRGAARRIGSAVWGALNRPAQEIRGMAATAVGEINAHRRGQSGDRAQVERSIDEAHRMFAQNAAAASRRRTQRIQNALAMPGRAANYVGAQYNRASNFTSAQVDRARNFVGNRVSDVRNTAARAYDAVANRYHGAHIAASEQLMRPIAGMMNAASSAHNKLGSNAAAHRAKLPSNRS